MGIPIENLISKMYEKTAKEAAKAEVDKAFAEEPEEGAAEDDKNDGKKEDKKLAGSASAAPGSKSSALQAGGIKLQRDMSTKSVLTADTSLFLLQRCDTFYE